MIPLLDMPDLSWQMDLLVLDALITIPVAWVIFKANPLRTLSYTVINSLWSAVCVVLLLSGGLDSWQHRVYLTLLMLAMMVSFNAGFGPERDKPILKTEVKEPLLKSTITAALTTYLIIGGA